MISVDTPDASTSARPAAVGIDYAAHPEPRPRRRWAWGAASLALGVANPLGYLLLAEQWTLLWPMSRLESAALALTVLAVPVVGSWLGVVARRGPNRARGIANVGLLINSVYLVITPVSVLILLLLLF